MPNLNTVPLLSPFLSDPFSATLGKRSNNSFANFFFQDPFCILNFGASNGMIVHVLSLQTGTKLCRFLPSFQHFLRCSAHFHCCGPSVVRCFSIGTAKTQPKPSSSVQVPTSNGQNVPTKGLTDEQLVEGSATEWTADELALKEKAIAENAWTPIYRYDGFVGVWFVLRLNLLLFAFSLATLPLSILQEWPIAPSLGLILWASVVFAAIKKYYTRIVAVISVDTATRSIYRIGYPSIFAARRNRFVRLLDVVPLSSNMDSVRGVARLRFTDGPKDGFLLLPTVNVEILDKKGAFLLFGSALKHFDKDIVPSAEDELRKKKVKEMLRLRMEKRMKAHQQQIGEEKREEAPKIEGG